MSKINILRKILLVIIISSNIFSLYCCSYPDGGTAVYAQLSDALSDALKTAEVYRQFLDGRDGALPAAIDKAKKTANDTFSSREDMDVAAASLIEAADNFRMSYFKVDAVKTKNSELVRNLYVGVVKCAYDRKSETFYYTMGTTPQRSFEFNFTVESGLNQVVFAEILDGGDILPYSFVPELNKEYTVRAYSDAITFDYKIIFTMLPIVQINNINRIGEDYKNCVISVTDPDFAYIGTSSRAVSPLFVESTAKIQVRGGISRSYPKKSYALKFVDGSGANKDMPFFSLRNDSDWILDAMFIDKARSRNRVSTDIWHAMESPLYYAKETSKPPVNGTHGTFVEVFINDDYTGLYCFTEKIDRKQLQLLKNDGGDFRSVIYKGKSWGDAVVFKGLPDYRNRNSEWDGFVQKFPNPSAGGEIRWEPLYDFVKFFLESFDEDFEVNADKYIDINNFVDYAILLCISYAHDNTGKNAYWSVYDVTDANLSKLFLTPWDLDATWGRSWDGSRKSPTAEWMDSMFGHDTALFRRLVLTNAGGFADRMRSRWSELKDNVLSVDSIINRFIVYFGLFEESGAWERESARWSESGLNMESELSYITEWTRERWDYIDNIIMNELDTVGRFGFDKPWR